MVLDGFDETQRTGPLGAIGSLFRQSAGRIIGSRLTEEVVMRRESEIPLDKARLGAVAVHEGIEEGDDEKSRFGAAMVVSAVTEVDAGQHAPDVAEAVTEIAASLPIETVAHNPFVAPPAAERVVTFLEKHDEV